MDLAVYFLFKMPANNPILFFNSVGFDWTSVDIDTFHPFSNFFLPNVVEQKSNDTTLCCITLREIGEGKLFNLFRMSNTYKQS